MGTLCRVVAVLLVVVATPTVAGPGLAQSEEPETDNTVTRIAVQPDGDARWTVRVRTRLATDEEATTYRAFQDRFRDDTDSYLGQFRERIRAVVASAADATGREMRATNFTASTSVQEVPRRWGVVSYSFTWENFAAERDGAVVVGDTFQGGLLVTENDTLAVRAPPGYAVETVDPPPTRREDDTLVWLGRVDFADERPRVQLVPDASTTSTGGADGSDGRATGSGLGTPAAVLAVALLALAATAAVLFRRRDGGGTAPPAGVARADGSDETDAGTGREPATEAEGEADTAVPENPLLSDEERVVELLEGSDGRLRQADIAGRMDWSASKTSRTVSALAEEGTVEKLRIGRENVVVLAESDQREG